MYCGKDPSECVWCVSISQRRQPNERRTCSERASESTTTGKYCVWRLSNGQWWVLQTTGDNERKQKRNGNKRQKREAKRRSAGTFQDQCDEAGRVVGALGGVGGQQPKKEGRRESAKSKTYNWSPSASAKMRPSVPPRRSDTSLHCATVCKRRGDRTSSLLRQQQQPRQHGTFNSMGMRLTDLISAFISEPPLGDNSISTPFPSFRCPSHGHAYFKNPPDPRATDIRPKREPSFISRFFCGCPTAPVLVFLPPGLGVDSLRRPKRAFFRFQLSIPLPPRECPAGHASMRQVYCVKTFFECWRTYRDLLY